MGFVGVGFGWGWQKNVEFQTLLNRGSITYYPNYFQFYLKPFSVMKYFSIWLRKRQVRQFLWNWALGAGRWRPLLPLEHKKNEMD